MKWISIRNPITRKEGQHMKRIIAIGGGTVVLLSMFIISMFLIGLATAGDTELVKRGDASSKFNSYAGGGAVSSQTGKPVLENEYDVMIGIKKNGKAYDILCGKEHQMTCEKGEKMPIGEVYEKIRELGIEKEVKHFDSQYFQHKDLSCLQCGGGYCFRVC